ncbi:MAG: hypothetical protein L0Y75_01280 [Acidobacteria bacterium]|nr:hypothetical protein [Acidobacteriota bacterium]
MNSNRRGFIAASLLSAGAFSLPASAQDKTKPSGEAQTVSIRGRVICLTEELQKPYQVIPDCEKRGHVYTLKTNDGKLYPFLPVDTAAAVWMDERYRQRELRVTARLFPQTNFIEVIKLQSWLKGRLHNLYYYCEICAITAHKPGPCECCQEPVEFRETPAEDNPF